MGDGAIIRTRSVPRMAWPDRQDEVRQNTQSGAVRLMGGPGGLVHKKGSTSKVSSELHI